MSAEYTSSNYESSNYIIQDSGPTDTIALVSAGQKEIKPNHKQDLLPDVGFGLAVFAGFVILANGIKHVRGGSN